jgi:tricorn protease-like protein
MILYNTTYSVAAEVGPDWVSWMKKFYLPAVMATRLPVGHKMLRLLTELDNEGITYSVQLDFNDMADYTTFLGQHADTMQKRIQHRFGGQYVSFDTLLEEI